MQLVWAIVPLAIVVVLLVGFKQSAVLSGFIGLIASNLIVWLDASFHMSIEGTIHSVLNGMFLSLVVVYVLFFGIFLYHLMNETGSISGVASWVARTTTDPAHQVLLLVISFSPLVESVSGFGVAVIVIAPILIELGFSRSKAVLLSLVSLSAVPWGALAIGTLLGSQLTGLSATEISEGSALLSVLTFLYLANIAVFLTSGWRGIYSNSPEILLLASVLSATVWATSRYISVELSGVMGGTSALLAEWLMLTWRREKVEPPQQPQRFWLHISPYLILVIWIASTRLIPWLESYFLLHGVLRLPSYQFELPLLYSPGFALLVASIYTILLFRLTKKSVICILHMTARQWWPVALSTVAFVSMSNVMSSSGMTATLATAAVVGLGGYYLWLSPFIAGLGGFLTGSNTGANAMFIRMQTEAAHLIGIPQLLIASVQNTAASLMTMASPSRVLLAVTVANATKHESQVLRNMLVISLGSILLVALGTYIWLNH